MPKVFNLNWTVSGDHGQDIIFNLRLRDIGVEISCAKDILFMGNAGY